MHFERFIGDNCGENMKRWLRAPNTLIHAALRSPAPPLHLRRGAFHPPPTLCATARPHGRRTAARGCVARTRSTLGCGSTGNWRAGGAEMHPAYSWGLIQGELALQLPLGCHCAGVRGHSARRIIRFVRAHTRRRSALRWGPFVANLWSARDP